MRQLLKFDTKNRRFFSLVFGFNNNVGSLLFFTVLCIVFGSTVVKSVLVNTSSWKSVLG